MSNTDNNTSGHRTPRHLFLPLALAMLLAGTALPARAETPALRLGKPVDCRIPDECAVMNHFDHEDDEAELDSNCGSLTYDGHLGTDFGLFDLNAMRRGVPVLAAAAGTVLRTRDGEPDIDPAESREAALRGRGAGNTVIIDHGNGWQTQYGHMRAGSLAVRPGDHVESGAQIGLVGQSGLASFPHLHLEVRHNGRAIDPYTGRGGACRDFSGSLWNRDAAKELAYHPTGLTRAGFAREAPVLEIIHAGGYPDHIIPLQPETLTFWVEIYGLRKGDTMRIRLIDANGKPVATFEDTAERHRARQMWFTGDRRPQPRGWPGDHVTGQFELRRDGETVLAVKRTLKVR